MAVRRSRAAVFVLPIATAALVCGAVLALAQSGRQIQYLRGQNVAPVYDGFEVNPDGTFSMWFGYFNRNQEEHLEIPIGTSNQFEPGPADRGQPTHFVPAWQKSVFRIVVPKDFGDRKLTWRLTANGKTDTVIASLDRRSMIDRQKTTIEGTKDENLAPKVTVEPSTQAVQLSQAATFTVKPTDDGLPLNVRTKQPEGLAIRWRKYRGPAAGLVTFSPAGGPLPDWKGDTKVTFTEPGEYVLQAVVDDGSLLTGTYCCWVNTEVRVTVK